MRPLAIERISPFLIALFAKTPFWMPFFLTSNFELKKESLIKGIVMFFYSSWPSGTVFELFLYHSIKTNSLVIIYIFTIHFIYLINRTYFPVFRIKPQ